MAEDKTLAGSPLARRLPVAIGAGVAVQAASPRTDAAPAPEVDEFSRPIEKYIQAAAVRPQIIVPPRSTKQLVSISCQFGVAQVSVSFRENLKPFLVLPGAGTWEWILGAEECLIGATTADTFVTGVARDLP